VTSTPPLRDASCPDWCVGDPASHSSPEEVVHRGAEYSISGSYGKGLLACAIVQFEGREPEFQFVGDGSWPGLAPEQVAELINDMAGHSDVMRALQDQLVAARAAHAQGSAARAGG
jgi:hypothetical protein